MDASISEYQLKNEIVNAAPQPTTANGELLVLYGHLPRVFVKLADPLLPPGVGFWIGDRHWRHLAHDLEGAAEPTKSFVQPRLLEACRFAIIWQDCQRYWKVVNHEGRSLIITF